MSYNHYFDHAVRIRTLEKSIENIDKRFDKLEQKIDSHFKWTIGTILSIILVVIAAKFI
jgi:hypothetical protein